MNYGIFYNVSENEYVSDTSYKLKIMHGKVRCHYMTGEWVLFDSNDQYIDRDWMLAHLVIRHRLKIMPNIDTIENERTNE